VADSFTSSVLDLERDGPVATLWLNRPEARNAMGQDFWDDLPVAMAEVSTDPEVQVVIIAARGPHFSAGLDLFNALGGIVGGSAEHDDPPPSMAARAATARRGIVRLQASINAVAECAKPVIAAVHGFCIGGGVDLIAACDIRLAAADAVFSVRETRLAIVADLGSLQRLPAIIGPGHLAELAFTGKDIDAAWAERIGLVNRIAGPGARDVHSEAQRLASEIAANSPIAVQGTKAVLAAGDGRTVAEGLDYVATWNAGMLPSDDLTEAVTAFMQKRPARFTGR
jgi:enoyl-CoA hydratase